MRIKKYEAETMQKALFEVKKDLGQDAVILHTKTRKKDGLLGLWGKEMVEITASADINIIEKPIVKKPSQVVSSYNEIKSDILPTTNIGKPVGPRVKVEDCVVPQQKEELSLLHKDIDEVKSLVLSILKKSKHSEVSSFNDELLEAYLMLIEHEVSEELSKDIVNQIKTRLQGDSVKDKQVIQGLLHNSIKKMFKSIEPIELKTGKAKKVALIGPTGVGKTTTIAKLAAEFSLRRSKKVALITIDTYRIAAVDQLRTYADIMRVPLEVVLSPAEIKHAIDKHKECDLILIDTAGRSQKNDSQMDELRNYLDVIDPDETHLVLSLTANFKNLQDIIDKFSSVNVDKVIFTKLDEAVTVGLVLNVLNKLDKSLSYVTTGQNVPDDIVITDPNMIANIIINANEDEAQH